MAMARQKKQQNIISSLFATCLLQFAHYIEKRSVPHPVHQLITNFPSSSQNLKLLMKMFKRKWNKRELLNWIRGRQQSRQQQSVEHDIRQGHADNYYQEWNKGGMRTSNLIVAKLCDTAAGRWHSIIRGNQIMQQTEPLFALSLSLPRSPSLSL